MTELTPTRSAATSRPAMPSAKPFWDKIARRYAQRPVKDPDAYRLTLDRTAHYLSASDHVLELGCGTGTTALKLAERVAAYTATDLSSEMIAIGREKAQAQGAGNLDFLASDIFGDALRPGAYDAVLAFNLLHLLEDTPAALRRVHRLVKPGGLFISKTVCLAGHMRLVRMLLPLLQWLGKAPYVKCLGIEDLDRAVQAAGFEIVETGNYPAKPPARFIVARRI